MLTSTLMATWFLAQGWANWVGGFIAQFASTETVAGVVLDPGKSLATSNGVFAVIGWVAVGIGLLFMAASPWLKRWAHGVNDPLAHAMPEPIAPTVDGERSAVSPAMIRAEREG